MDRTTIMLPANLKKGIRKRARKMGITMGKLIRLSVERFVGLHPGNRDEDPLISGDFVIKSPGPADVSRNIHKYLYGNKA